MRIAFKLVCFALTLVALSGLQALGAPVFLLSITETDGYNTTTQSGGVAQPTVTNSSPTLLPGGALSLVLNYSSAMVTTNVDTGLLATGTMHLDVVNLLANASGLSPTNAIHLVVTLTANDLVIPNTAPPITLAQAAGGANLLGMSVSSTTTVDPNNGVPAVPGFSVTTGPQAGVSWSSNLSTPIVLLGSPLSNPFSMSITNVIDITGNGVLTNSMDTISTVTDSNGHGFTQNPEPASLAIWGLALAGTGLARVRRRKTIETS